MAKIDIDRLICSLIERSMMDKLLEKCLKDQNLEYKDGEIQLIPLTDEQKAYIDEMVKNGSTARYSDLVYADPKDEEAVTNEPIIARKPDIDMDAMVEKYKYNLQANNDRSIKYIPVEGIVSAYEKGLKDMYNKMKK